MFEFTEVFCTIDDFFQQFEPIYWQFLKDQKVKARLRPTCLSLSEIVFIAVWYKQSAFKHFKAFFWMLKCAFAHLFKKLPCYQRLIYLINDHQLALNSLHYALTLPKQAACPQLLWIDATCLPVCKNQRINRHQSIKPIATRGMSSMGWFYGCKLHVLMNQDGEIVRTRLSNGHVSDIKMVEPLTNQLSAKVYADRGYISAKLKATLKNNGVELITNHRKNMPLAQLSTVDNYYLRQRSKIETLFGLLKESYSLVTSRYRSVKGYLSGIYASLCAYQICNQNMPKIQSYL